jgi:hypothetical protein
MQDTRLRSVGVVNVLIDEGGAKSGIVIKPRRLLNSQANWDAFDSRLYLEHNYRTLRDDDQQIIDTVRDFFADAGVVNGRGFDVGTGSNLYPAMSMLPFCDQIVLHEYGADNLAWLRQELPSYNAAWDRFWSEFAANSVYAQVSDPRTALAQHAKVRRASIFNLHPRAWDMGTMFFVACSISTDIHEFNRAVGRFAGALRPGAPFAAAFMIDSEGYYVGNNWFPAVKVSVDAISESLAGQARDVQLHDIQTKEPLRDGYGGMCLATGWAVA